MYGLDVDTLQFSIGRLRQLRELLPTVPRYDHSCWGIDCNTPCCAGGWATTLWPNELFMTGLVLFRRDCKPAISTTFRVSHTLKQYLFGYHFNRKDNSLTETLRRFDVAIAYLQRRLDKIESESRDRMKLCSEQRTTSHVELVMGA